VIRAAAILAFALALGTGAGAQSDVDVTSGQGAVMRALDKVNGHTVDTTMLSGGGQAILGLEVELADCRYPTNNPTGDAYAFLTIRSQGSSDILFQGWMMASSPALNALDHSRYDLWVLNCTTS
jgi:hypothetical protein